MSKNPKESARRPHFSQHGGCAWGHGPRRHSLKVRLLQRPHPAEDFPCAAANPVCRDRPGQPSCARTTHRGDTPRPEAAPGLRTERNGAARPAQPSRAAVRGPCSNYKSQNAPEALVYPSNLPMRARGARHVSGARFPSAGGARRGSCAAVRGER